ncbi:hypothetical protein [Stutzerimonas zhaodongensis]|uniref:hypothetical protein n=1 Tax=Stutzerimonas zhaodongensis TaxID=1176257 RepID=UPI0011C39E96|nr:hypothetical protein [Stutzerimonas zhaodongensis]MCQ4317989.1 hypothetical protein [Stutzerimonas zhaodongensis]
MKRGLVPGMNFNGREFRDGAIFDFNSCIGQSRMFFIFGVSLAAVWWMPGWFPWVQVLVGVDPHKFSDSEVSLGRFWALIFGGSGMALSLLRIFILLRKKSLKEKAPK